MQIYRDTLLAGRREAAHHQPVEPHCERRRIVRHLAVEDPGLIEQQHREVRDLAVPRIRLRLRQGPDEREFDDRFWRELGPVKRLEAVWDMVLEAPAWKGEDPGQSRLQRSVLRVERR